VAYCCGFLFFQSFALLPLSLAGSAAKRLHIAALAATFSGGTPYGSLPQGGSEGGGVQAQEELISKKCTRQHKYRRVRKAFNYWCSG